VSTDLPDDRWDWIGTIETVSGIDFPIFEPNVVKLDIKDIATALGNICRYNGHVPHFYSVAEHSMRVADAMIMKGATKEQALTGLLHDAAEAYVGDMVRPLKLHDDFSRLHQEVEDRIIRLIHETFGGIYPHDDLVHECDKEIYLWEMEHIRTGKERGMHPTAAGTMWLDCYHILKNPDNVVV
jgi:hypothetical protein